MQHSLLGSSHFIPCPDLCLLSCLGVPYFPTPRRSRLFPYTSVQDMASTLCYSSRRPGSSPSSLREQHYLINVYTFLTFYQIEASLLPALSPLTATVVRLLSSLLPFVLHCESHLPSQTFLFLTNTPGLSLLYTHHSLSPSSFPGAIHHLFYNLSLSILVRFIQPGRNEQQLFCKLCRL